MAHRKLLLVVLGCAIVLTSASRLEGQTGSTICSQEGTWIAPSVLPCFVLVHEVAAVSAVPANTDEENRLVPIQQLSAPEAILPDAPSSSAYLPLSARSKFDLFLAHTSSPETFLGITLDAGWAQLANDWPGYGQGMQGFGKRWGALIADRQAKSFLGSFLLPTLLHQDPRYFRLGRSQSLWRRVGYALSRVGVTRSDHGHDTFNSSLVLSTLLVTSLSNAYYPRQQRGLSQTMSRFGGSMLGSAQSCLLREFLPDIMHIFRKHGPGRLTRLERKLPFLRKLDPVRYPDLAQAPR
jgi:hypothetical protein